MSREVIEEKVESLRRCLARVQGRVPATADALVADLDAQDIIALNLERAVQLSVDAALHVLSRRNAAAPKTMSETFTALAREGVITAPVAERMTKAVGFRNIAVHAYRELDWHVVFSIATRHLDDFRSYVGEVMAWVEAHAD